MDSILARSSPTDLPRVAFVRPREASNEDEAAPVPGVRPAEQPRKTRLAEAAITSLLSAYMPERVGIETPFALLLHDPNAAAPPAELPHGVSGNGRDHWWSDRPLPHGVDSEESLKCLAQAIYFESRGEPVAGQEAVAQVVMNRVKNPSYPDDVCGVVYQNRKWFNRCQFTFACDRHSDDVREPEAWEVAMEVAKRYATGETWRPDIGAATHYHALHVSPKWANVMRAVKTIENHRFYMTLGGGWS